MILLLEAIVNFLYYRGMFLLCYFRIEYDIYCKFKKEVYLGRNPAKQKNI